MKIVRTAAMDWQTALARGRFENHRKDLGGDKMRAGLWQLPPGKRSFPLHQHLATEEALFVVAGRAKVRTKGPEGEGEHEIGPGDYVSFPAGGVAHQLINDGTEPLVYLAMSAGVGIDLVEYPDSKKVAAAAGVGPGARRFVFPADSQVDYWHGEET